MKAPSNLAVVSNNTFNASKAVHIEHYDISTALQTTIEFNELIPVFSQKIQPLILHNSYEYRHSELEVVVAQGIQARHQCCYTLKIEERYLGELTLTRRQRFSKTDMQLLERLLCCLVYPLRNAVLFYQALQMAYTDPLTKVRNRASFMDSLQRETLFAERGAIPLSAIFLDIDHFKAINDGYGHDCGDFVLTAIAQTLKACVRGCDMIFRYGGEEFVILLSNTDSAGAELLAERIRQHIEHETLAYGLDVLNVTASLGVATWRHDDTLTTFIKRADDAMYRAKRCGRNRVVVA